MFSLMYGNKFGMNAWMILKIPATISTIPAQTANTVCGIHPLREL